MALMLLMELTRKTGNEIMDLAQIGGFLTAAAGAVAIIYGVIRARRADLNSAEAAKDAKMVTNFQTLYENQQKQITGINEELIRVKNEQADERAQWAEERKGFQRIIAEKDEIIRKLGVEIAELREQVNSNQRVQKSINEAKS